MKIAVPVTANNLVDDHFGHCEFFSVFTVSTDNKISGIKSIPSLQGCGCKSNIVDVLAKEGVSIMLAGGIGAGAINVLNSAGIDVIRGCTGLASDVVTDYISGAVKDSGESCQLHHDHHQNDGTHQCHH